MNGEVKMEERERGKGGGKGRGKGDMEGEKGESKKERGGDYVSTVPVSCRQVAARVVSRCGDTRPFSCSSCEPT